MTARESAVLVYRSLGIWFAANAAYDGASRIPFFDAEWAWHRTLWGFFPPVAHLLAGYLLWHYAGRLASATFSKEGEARTSAAIDVDRLLPVAFSALGAWCVVEALPALVSGLAELWTHAPHSSLSLGSGGDPGEGQLFLWTLRTKAWTLAAAVRLGIGLCLLTGPARLARVVQWMRLELRGSLDEDAPAVPAETNERQGGA